MKPSDVIVIGAGPYGLSAGAFLRRAGLEVHVVGDPMSFWQRHMPTGLLLRSAIHSSQIGAQTGDLTLEAFAAATGATLVNPLPSETFVDYGMWFQRKAIPDLDRRRVVHVLGNGRGFQVSFDDGEEVEARRVVIAAGIDRFAWVPGGFARLGPDHVSHSAEHSSLERFEGVSVLVVGGGQSALESAALLAEAGATVEVVLRRPEMRILRGAGVRKVLGPLSSLAYPPEDVGPPGINLFTVRPRLFRRLPRPLQTKLARRAIRPAGAAWLVPRLQATTVTAGVELVSVEVNGEGVRVRLDDGASRTVDHVLFGTGFRVDVARYEFLAPELVGRIRQADGYPVLTSQFESSVTGLYFLGAPAAWSFGPLMRFVSGTWFTTTTLTRALVGAARE